MSLFRCLFIAGFIRASRIKLAQSRSSSVYSLRYLLPKRRLCPNAVAELSENKSEIREHFDTQNSCSARGRTTGSIRGVNGSFPEV